MPASSARSLPQIGGGVRAVGRGGRRIGGDERIADGGDCGLRVARVVPPVRVVARGLGAVALSASCARAPSRRGRRPRASRRRSRSRCPSTRRARRRSRTRARRRRPPRRRPAAARTRAGSVLGWRIWWTSARLARDRARPVADLRRGRHHVGARALAARRAPAAAGEQHGEQHGCAGERGAAAHCRRQRAAAAATPRRARRRAPPRSAPAAS